MRRAIAFSVILWYYSNHCMEIARGSGVAEIAWGIVESSEYQERQRRIIRGIGRAATRGFNPENLGEIVNRYIASGVADDILKERGDTDKALEDKILELIRVMPYWIQSEKNLESYRKGVFYERNNKMREKETVVVFNKILRAIVSEGQYTRKSELISDIENAMRYLDYGYKEVKNAHRFLNYVINGMRHEIAAEMTLNEVEGVQAVYTSSVEGDLAGTDILVEYVRGNKIYIFSFDIKSTKTAAREANSDKYFMDYCAIGSGFNYKAGDFGYDGDSLIPKRRVIRGKISYYKNILEEMAREEDCKRQNNQHSHLTSANLLRYNRYVVNEMEDNVSTPIKPLGDRVVAVREEAKTQTVSGIYLPDNAKEKPVVAEVKAVGGDVKNVKVGDRIVYKEYSTTDLKIDGTEYLIVREEDILATVVG